MDVGLGPSKSFSLTAAIEINLGSYHCYKAETNIPSFTIHLRAQYLFTMPGYFLLQLKDCRMET